MKRNRRKKMTDKCKPGFTLWGDGNNPGREVANIAWTGTKMVALVVVAGLALGLGLNAFGSASG